MTLDQQQLNDLIEAQYHYFESHQTEKAAEIVSILMEPLFDFRKVS